MKPERYDDMAELTDDLEHDATRCSYLPVADDYYLRDDATYTAVASARYAADGTTGMASVLVAAADSGIERAEDLKGRRLGIIHRFCTTSYFAPAIFLAQRGQRILDFVGDVVTVAAWQGQIDAVAAGTVDATMVLERVWDQAPNAAGLRVLGRQDRLPTPVAIVHRDAPARFRVEFSDLLLSHRPPVSAQTLSAGFAPFQREDVAAFNRAAARAFG